MSVINIAQQYENQAGSLDQAGALIAAFAKSALIIAGEKAYAAVAARLEPSLAAAGIATQLQKYPGLPTQAQAGIFAQQAASLQVQAVIAVGGGRILDLAKGVAALAGLPLVTIPTIAATCAAFSDLIVYYHPDGSQDCYVFHDEPPRLIIVDPEVLLAAPAQYLHSGVVDSIAKYYEVQSSFNGNRHDLVLRLQIKVSELILETLEQDYTQAFKRSGSNVGTKVSTVVLQNTLDAIILLAGLVGAIKGNVAYGGLAHHFYNQTTKIPITQRRLHGEVVSYGLLVQWVIEGRDDSYVSAHQQDFALLGQPVTLAELGITDAVESSVTRIAQLMKEAVGEYSSAARELTERSLIEAIYHVDTLGGHVRKGE
ncbi:MAG: iron-containing alcohol dehydrogenase [Coriobacteriales bacterium]|jgi:glycerol dehydrogenase|nr:iron-containing alcohol dehydrogenase [Coriobacteriales bacterium]